MVCNLGRRDRAVRIAVGALIAVAAFPLRTHALMAIALLVTGLAFMVGAAVGY